MNELLNKYNKIATEQNKAVHAITAFVRDALPFLILILNIAVAVTSRLFTTDLQNPFTADFFVELFTNMLTTMVCYVCFVKYGEKNEKALSASYHANVERWQKMSGEVRKKKSDDFIAYCKRQVELERDDIRTFYIYNHTMLTLEEYESKYKKLSNEELDGLVSKGALSRKEAWYIKRANGTRYLKPINPMVILCGVNKMNINDVGRDGISAATVSIVTRPIYMFVLAAVVTMFSGYWKGLDDASALFDIIYSAVMVVIASIAGYTAGADAGRKEHDKVRGRIFFLERYLAAAEKAEDEKLTGDHEVARSTVERSHHDIKGNEAEGACAD